MKYNRAPITEAVLELRFTHPQPKDVAEKAAASLEKSYFYNELEQSLSFSLEANVAKVETKWEGKKLSSLDRADVVIFRTSAFVCSRLAPYMGWEEFLPQARRAWEIWRKHAGSVEIARIGLRYVNRIDIPLKEGQSIDVENYLCVLPKSPDSFKLPMINYLVQIVRPLETDGCNVLLTSATIPSPLVNTLSLALDLDVFRETDIPRREDELWALINRMRDHKNFVFENSITDLARKLFT
jgi:uncharacterized protein (TIGR04255 family)